jgi:hypothetical protein
MSDIQAIADRAGIEALRGEFTDAVMMRDYERLPATHEATVYWAMITLMTRRLARPG